MTVQDHSYIEYKAFLLCGRICVIRLLHLQSDTELWAIKTAKSDVWPQNECCTAGVAGRAAFVPSQNFPSEVRVVNH